MTEPDRLAFAAAGERMTWRELDDAADRLAGDFEAKGVRPGDGVPLFLPAGLDFVRTFYGLLRLGAVPCAFSPSLVEDRRSCLSSQYDADIAHLQPTSGTSGEPRLAMVTHTNIAASISSSQEAMGFGPDDILVAWVPPWHDLGLVRFVLTPVFIGAPCHIVTPAVANIPHWLATIDEVGGTVTGAPDFAWRLATRLVRPGSVSLKTLRCATNGGEPVKRSTMAAVDEAFGLRGVLLAGYGLAEATLGVASMRPGDELRVDDRGGVACGKALPGVEVRVDDEGEILVRGANVLAGYFDAPEDTAAALREGWLHTGDVGHLDADGNLYVLGRRRSMLKRGGAPLAPRELEEAAQSVDGVKVAAAVGIASDDSTEEIVIAVEAESEYPGLVDAVGDAVRRAIGFTPERVLVLPPRSIPRTANGKVRYQALRERISDLTCAVSSSGRSAR